MGLEEMETYRGAHQPGVEAARRADEKRELERKARAIEGQRRRSEEAKELRAVAARRLHEEAKAVLFGGRTEI